MGLFCLLWIPLCYFLRRTLATGPSGVLAFVCGILAVVVQLFVGSLVPAEGFGVSRWLSAFVDVVSLPVLVPLVLYLLFVEMRLVSPSADYSSFVLLWLVPLSLFRLGTWIFPSVPLMLVLPPVLWSSLALGIPRIFASMLRSGEWRQVVPRAAAIAVLPFAAATSWWAFFSHRPVLGGLCLAATCLPALAAVGLAALPVLKGMTTDKAEPEPDFDSE
ncbi:MAG: hypothetical protein FWD94_03220 [Treponema sp.]|nr:hypothetical protein [Treponema sp.]